MYKLRNDFTLQRTVLYGVIWTVMDRIIAHRYAIPICDSSVISWIAIGKWELSGGGVD